MTSQDDSLKNRMMGWEAPQPDPVRKHAALQEALAVLAAPSPLPSGFLRVFRPSARVISQCAAALIIGTALVWWFMPRQAPVHAPHETMAATPEITLETLREISQLFPGQLDAIIAGPNGLDLRLSPPVVPGATDQPVLVTLASDHERRTIITYSGRRVNFDFAGSPRSITPLIDGDGAVIVLTPDRVFSPAVAESGEDFRVSASTLANR